MTNFANMKLGKLAPVHRPGSLLLASYLPETRLPIPDSLDNVSCLKRLGMMANDRLRDCTCAAAGHMIQCWTAKNGAELALSDDVIVGAYSAITGYSPSNPDSDQGAVEADVLAYWKRHGFGGHKIESHAIVETASEYQVKLAMWLFGSLYTGVALPLSAQDQRLWAVVHGSSAEAGSWGGHAVPLLGYDAHTATCVTWGAPLKMTWAWQKRYMDEAYACLSPDWIDRASKMAPNHLDWAKLQADLKSQFREAA